MEIKLTFDELTAYVQKRYGQSLNFSKAGDDTLCVTFSKKVLIKTIQIPVNIRFEKVTPTTVTISYDGKVLGLDMIISGALKALKSLLPELTEALTTSEGHHISVDLARLKQTRSLVKTVALRAVSVGADSLTISAALL